MAINWTAIAVTAVAAKACNYTKVMRWLQHYQGKTDIALLQGRTKGVKLKIVSKFCKNLMKYYI